MGDAAEAVDGAEPPAGAPGGGQPSPGRPERRHRRHLVLKAAVAVMVGTVVYVAVTFVQVWRAESWSTSRPAQAIVVLGAAQYDGRPSPAYRGRLDHADALYRGHLAPTVVVTGSRQPGDRFTEAFAGFDYLRHKGVPESALVVVSNGTSTWESLAAAARILRARGMADVVLVSDPYHSFRSVAIAGEVGLQARVSPTGARSTFRELGREAVLVSVGRIIGYRRVVAWFE